MGDSHPVLEEEDVDENLTSFLAEPIKTQKRTYKEAFEEEVDTDAEDQDTPASGKTKEEIYRIWQHVNYDESEKLLPLIEKVSQLSQAQADVYLSCLKAINSQTVHKHLSSRVLNFFSQWLCHPDDILTPKAMQEDPYVINGISLFVSDILSLVGKFSLPLLLTAYATTSWYYFNQPTTTRKEKKNNTTPGAPTSTIQNDGVCPVTDGENVPHDQTHDKGMD
jgi:hypothetical protein